MRNKIKTVEIVRLIGQYSLLICLIIRLFSLLPESSPVVKLLLSLGALGAMAKIYNIITEEQNTYKSLAIFVFICFCVLISKLNQGLEELAILLMIIFMSCYPTKKAKR